jgi:hypothetical protein
MTSPDIFLVPVEGFLVLIAGYLVMTSARDLVRRFLQVRKNDGRRAP